VKIIDELMIIVNNLKIHSKGKNCFSHPKGLNLPNRRCPPAMEDCFSQKELIRFPNVTLNF